MLIHYADVWVRFQAANAIAFADVLFRGNRQDFRTSLHPRAIACRHIEPTVPAGLYREFATKRIPEPPGVSQSSIQSFIITSNNPSVQIRQFIEGLFTMSGDISRFKLHIRDFLIQLKEFSDDNAELYAEDREQAQQAAKDAERERAKQVGGLMKPSEIDQDDEL